ncbi:MAG: gliding motility-associated ABC transporter permease subunit GldF [Bacteroidales bacterium]|nr:gliding motility-associated ABC transporter permease subunit GldF [Bacteroidales bacterium]
MYALYKKELGSFFSSLMGYLTIFVFLLLNGLMLWVFRSDFNILDYGFADLGPFFLVSPFLFLFLIPAITMRMFAEEKRSGTMELLLTKPISDITIIAAKFLAGLTLALLALLPTIVYYITVYHIADPVGNVDSGAVFGSYIGLLLLAAVFVSIGLFASVITKNQIVAFIVAIVLCFFCYLGFETLYQMSGSLFVKSLGIRHHYESVSRGVIDTRDVLYYLSVIVIFLTFTYLALQSRKWKK